MQVSISNWISPSLPPANRPQGYICLTFLNRDPGRLRAARAASAQTTAPEGSNAGLSCLSPQMLGSCCTYEDLGSSGGNRRSPMPSPADQLKRVAGGVTEGPDGKGCTEPRRVVIRPG